MCRKMFCVIRVVLLLSLVLRGTAGAAYVNNPMTEDLDVNGFSILDVNNLTATDIIAKGPWVDVDAYDSFSAAIDAVGSAEKTLLISSIQVVNVNKTVPSNVTLRFLHGGELNISSDKTVTIEGLVEAGLYEIFTGDGQVAFNNLHHNTLYPQWWGAKGDYSTDDTAALQAAFDAVTSAGTLIIPKGTYLFNDTLIFDQNYATLECQGYLTWTGDANTAIIIGNPSTDYTTHIRASINLANSDPNWAVDSIGIACKKLIQCHIKIYRCRGFKTGLSVGGKGYNQFTLGDMRENKIGVDLIADDANGVWTNQNIFYGGRFQFGIAQRDYTGSRYINIPHNSTWRCDNNTFIAPCFECVTKKPDYFVYCGGNANAFIHPRGEGDANEINVFFTSSSTGNIWLSGAGTTDLSDFNDSGEYNRIISRTATKWGERIETITDSGITYTNASTDGGFDISAGEAIFYGRDEWTTVPALQIQGYIPSVRQIVKRGSSGGFAWSIAEMQAKKGTSDPVDVGKIGLFGDMPSEGSPYGKYMYFGVGSDVSYNNAFMKIDSNDGLGLGLSGYTRPSCTLDVNGDVSISGDIDIGDAGGFSGMKFNATDTTLDFYIDGTKVGYIGTDGAYVDDIP